MCLSYEIQWVFPQEGKVLHGPTEFTSALITPPPGCRSHGNASALPPGVFLQNWHHGFPPGTLCPLGLRTSPSQQQQSIILRAFYVSHNNLREQINFLSPFYRYFTEKWGPERLSDLSQGTQLKSGQSQDSSPSGIDPQSHLTRILFHLLQGSPVILQVGH